MRGPALALERTLNAVEAEVCAISSHGGVSRGLQKALVVGRYPVPHTRLCATPIPQGVCAGGSWACFGGIMPTHMLSSELLNTVTEACSGHLPSFKFLSFILGILPFREEP